MDLKERQRQLQEFLGELDSTVVVEDSENDECIMQEVDLMIDEDLKNEAKDIDDRLVDAPTITDMIPDPVSTKNDSVLVAEE